MQKRFDKKKYGQRWQCETVISMIKRRQAVATSGRSYWSQCRGFTSHGANSQHHGDRMIYNGFLQRITDTFYLPS